MSSLDPQLERRLVSLEEWIMHTDRLVADLDSVVCTMQNRIDEQARQIKELQQKLDSLGDSETEDRSFEDERPPHY
jgi:SlyX protein